MEDRQHLGGKTKMTGSVWRARLSAVVEAPWLVVPVVVLAATLLSVGITRDYRLKHEDNNALHTTFAHSHQKAGLSITKGHDAYINAYNGKITFYGHHPPGVGLLLAGVFSVSGHDGQVVVRGVAIAATLLMLVSVWWIVRREAGAAPALVAALGLAVIPQAAFYGRMVNHETLALPAIVIMVDRYFALARGGGSRAGAVLVIAATVGALMAWVTFFALAACALHALLARRRPSTFPAAGRAFTVVVSLGLGLFAFNLAHIAWVKGGDLGDLVEILTRRVGAGQPYGPFEWLHKMLGFSRRLATVSGTVALGWLGFRTARSLIGKITLDPVEEIAAIFLGTGLGYLVVFNWGAWQHHYWQFPLLPAIAVALALAVSSIARRAGHGPRPKIYRILLILMIFEIVATSTVGLSVRHSRAEDRVIEVVENLRTKFL